LTLTLLVFAMVLIAGESFPAAMRRGQPAPTP
jgi:hypothetical protein